MAEATKSDPTFSATDVQESVAYRAISPLAVASLLLGAASALALVHPGLWIVPPVAAAVAIWALRVIAARKTELMGRSLALLGLWLALLFGGWAPARLISRQVTLTSQARAHADEWLDLLKKGKLYEAYELHLKIAERRPAGDSLAEIYGDLSLPVSGSPMDAGPGGAGEPGGLIESGLPGVPSVPAPMKPKPQFAIRTFYDEPAMKALLSACKSGELVFLGRDDLRHLPETLTDDVTLQYNARDSHEGKSISRTLQITLTRVLDAKTRQAHWHVTSVVDPARGP